MNTHPPAASNCYMPPFLSRIWALLKRVVKSTWMVPVLCVAAAVLYAAFVVLYAELGSDSRAWDLLGEVVAGLSLLSFALLLGWLIGSMFLKQTFGQRGLRVLFSVLGGGAALVIVVGATFFEMMADPDHTADHWRVPEGVALEVPQNLWVEEDAPDIVKRIVGRDNNEQDARFSQMPEGDFPRSAAHLEQLAREHPDMLNELFQRATSLGKTEFLMEEAWDTKAIMGEYSYNICRAYLRKKGESGMEESHFTGDFTYTHPLGNGWELHMQAPRFTQPNEAKDRPQAIERLEGFAMQRLDERFAQLAASPTRETLNAILPLPASPCIFLCQGFQPGIYNLSLFLPKDARSDGHYEIRAFEYETGKKLSLDRKSDYLQFIGEPDDKIVSYELPDCRIITIKDFMVYTGNWGQYYGSLWELWFVPYKGEPTAICTQNFLMQGWMR